MISFENGFQLFSFKTVFVLKLKYIFYQRDYNWRQCRVDSYTRVHLLCKKHDTTTMRLLPLLFQALYSCRACKRTKSREEYMNAEENPVYGIYQLNEADGRKSVQHKWGCWQKNLLWIGPQGYIFATYLKYTLKLKHIWSNTSNVSSTSIAHEIFIRDATSVIMMRVNLSCCCNP